MDVRMGGSCNRKLTVIGWECLGPDYWDRDFGDGFNRLLCTDSKRACWAKAGQRLHGGRNEVRRT